MVWLLYSSSSTSMPVPFSLPFDCRATEASLSIICRETATMLSSINCWLTSSMSAENLISNKITNRASDKLTLLGVDLADVSGLKLVLGERGLLLDPLLVTLGEADELLHALNVVLSLLVEVLHLQRLRPDVLVQVHQHVLLETGLAVVDGNAVVVAVETVDEGLNGRLVQMTQVGCCLAGLLAHDDGLWLDETEGINDDLALDGLDGVDDHGNGAGSELFKGLLSVDIDGRKPAAETRMRVVPANNGLWSIA